MRVMVLPKKMIMRYLKNNKYIFVDEGNDEFYYYFLENDEININSDMLKNCGKYIEVEELTSDEYYSYCYDFIDEKSFLWKKEWLVPKTIKGV